MVQFQDNIMQNYLDYTSKHGKTYNSKKGSLRIVKQERKSTLEESDHEQSRSAREFNGIVRGLNLAKKSFLNNARLLFASKEKALNDF